MNNDGRKGAIDFGDVFDLLPSPHMVLDRNHCYVAVNKAYEAAVMRGRDELIGRNLFDLFPNDGESGKRLLASLDRVFETGEADTLAYIPYDIPRPPEMGGGMEQRYWTAVHTAISDRDGVERFVLQNTVDVTDIVRLRQAASLPFRRGETQLLERAREAEEQHRALMSESAEFRRLFQLAPGFFAVLSGPDHVFTFANDAYMRLVGDRQL
ncbi:PAS domain-containing protein, partial [Hoeflea olei]|uniref:PAS domain-containing protein n=1 Tax=Hoeflea olei TaxID=1480615 RepID=UPI001495DB6B